MNRTAPAFFNKINNPVFQALSTLSLEIFLILCSYAAGKAGWLEYGNRTPWILAGTFLLFFALFNSVFSLGAKDINQYWFLSTFSYAGLMIASGGVAYLFSSLSITEAGPFRLIFIVLTFGYLLFLSIMRVLRKIVYLAQREDDRWKNRP